MTPQQVVGVAVRLFAIWLVLLALQVISTAIQLHLQPDSGDTIVAYIFSGMYCVIAILLWLFPMTVAHSLVPRTQFDDVLDINAQQATVVAAVVLGMWLLAFRAIPAISFYATLGAYWIKKGQTISSIPLNQHIAFVVGVIELTIALALMFKAPRISKFILLKHKEDERS